MNFLKEKIDNIFEIIIIVYMIGLLFLIFIFRHSALDDIDYRGRYL